MGFASTYLEKINFNSQLKKIIYIQFICADTQLSPWLDKKEKEIFQKDFIIKEEKEIYTRKQNNLSLAIKFNYKYKSI